MDTGNELLRLCDSKGIKLTPSQRKAIEKLNEFFKDPGKKVFVLAGYAGTGKTFLLAQLVNYLNEKERSFYLSAPTGKAARLLTERTGINTSTIHSLIYELPKLVIKKEGELNENNNHVEYYAKLKTRDQTDKSVFIFDESSMISNQESGEGNLHFGSGCLLNDIFKYVNIRNTNTKVIFVGDPAQLPPVGSQFSPALNPEYLEKLTGTKVDDDVLTDLVRQKTESLIAQNTLEIRKCIENKDFGRLYLKTDPNLDLVEIKKNSFLDRLVRYTPDRTFPDIQVIAHTNQMVYEYNQAIRGRFGNNPCEVTVGDILISTQNSLILTPDNSGKIVNNGQFFHVKDVLEKSVVKELSIKIGREFTPVSLKVTKVNLIGFNPPMEMRGINILDDFLFSGDSQPNENQIQAIQILRKQLKIDINEGRVAEAIDRKNRIDSDILLVKFGYSITCHKAQGSEWKTVFLDCSYSNDQANESYFRWLYTAMTRAKQRLYVINPPSIRRLAAPEIGRSTCTSENLTEWIKKILTESYSVELMRKFSEYHHRFFVENDDDDCVIDIHINGKGKVTKVCIPSKEISDFANHILGKLNAVISSSNHNQNDSAKEELEWISEFDKALRSHLATNEIEVTGFKDFPWRLRYWLNVGNLNPVVDFSYNKKKNVKISSITNVDQATEEKIRSIIGKMDY